MLFTNCFFNKATNLRHTNSISRPGYQVSKLMRSEHPANATSLKLLCSRRIL